MEFMIGIYDVDKSGDTEKIRMRGSGRIAESSVDIAEVDGCVIRLISVFPWIKIDGKC